jgi:hypothetical protein
MGNITTKSVGDFQAKVGKVSGDIGVIISYITAGILILTAIGLAIAAMIPMKPRNCTKDHLNQLAQNEKMSCTPQSPPITSPIFGPGTQACNEATQDYGDEQKRCGTKVKQTWLLWFLLLIPLAVIIVVISRWWNHFMHTNKTAAQIGGTMFELNTLKDFMR